MRASRNLIKRGYPVVVVGIGGAVLVANVLDAEGLEGATLFRAHVWEEHGGEAGADAHLLATADEDIAEVIVEIAAPELVMLDNSVEFVCWT